jgi:drug/metabolite transporter (DMT)-like permease
MEIEAKPTGIHELISPKNLKIGMALLATYVVWGSTYLVVRFTIDSIPPFMLTALRSVIASVVLLSLGMMRGNQIRDKMEIRNAAIVGVLLFGGGAGLVAFSEKWVASGLAALGVAVVPIWASIFVGLWGKWPSRLEGVGLVIGLVGLFLLHRDNGMQANPIGAASLIAGPMLWALGSMLSRRLPMPDGMTGTGVQLLSGALFLFVISIGLGEQIKGFPTTQALLGLAYLTVMSSILTFSAYMYLVRTVRPVLATSYAYVSPVLAVLLGVVLAAETITPIGIVAMVVILIGVVVLAFGKERKQKIV